MKIKCLHGYFIFQERSPGQISRFISTYGFDIEPIAEGYTFLSLVGAPKYSISGGTYLGAPAIKTFEGEPWEVMEENDLVYDFTQDKVVPISTITQAVQTKQTANYFLANGLILPGSLTEEGLRVKDYAAFYLFDTVTFNYSELNVE